MKLSTKCFMSVLACCSFITVNSVNGMHTDSDGTVEAEQNAGRQPRVNQQQSGTEQQNQNVGGFRTSGSLLLNLMQQIRRDGSFDRVRRRPRVDPQQPDAEQQNQNVDDPRIEDLLLLPNRIQQIRLGGASSITRRRPRVDQQQPDAEHQNQNVDQWQTNPQQQNANALLPPPPPPLPPANFGVPQPTRDWAGRRIAVAPAPVVAQQQAGNVPQQQDGNVPQQQDGNVPQQQDGNVPQQQDGNGLGGLLQQLQNNPLFLRQQQMNNPQGQPAQAGNVPLPLTPQQLQFINALAVLRAVVMLSLFDNDDFDSTAESSPDDDNFDSTRSSTQNTQQNTTTPQPRVQNGLTREDVEAWMNQVRSSSSDDDSDSDNKPW